ADHIARRWEPAAGRQRASWQAWVGQGGIAALALSPDGRVLVAAGGIPKELTGVGRGEVKFWDTTSGNELLTLRAHEDCLHDMALSPDGRWLAVSCSERAVN